MAKNKADTIRTQLQDPRKPSAGTVRTQRDVARLAGVSLTTVYNAVARPQIVRERTRRKIFQIMEDFDYTPNAIARAMVKGSTKVLGIVVPRLDVSFWAMLVSSIERAADMAGYSCLICQHGDDYRKEDKDMSLLRQQQVDGLIVRPSDSRNEDAAAYERLRAAGTKFVILDKPMPGFEDCFVGSEDTSVSEEVVDYLISKGHRRIACIGHRSRSDWIGPRRQGYVNSLRKGGIEHDDRLVSDAPLYSGGRQEFHEMCRRLGDDRPTAVYALNDSTAMGVMKAAMELGLRVPDDLAVVGFGGYLDTTLFPVSLTRVHQPLDQMGYWAIKMLIEQLQEHKAPGGPPGAPPGGPVLLPCTLVHGGSA